MHFKNKIILLLILSMNMFAYALEEYTPGEYEIISHLYYQFMQEEELARFKEDYKNPFSTYSLPTEVKYNASEEPIIEDDLPTIALLLNKSNKIWVRQFFEKLHRLDASRLLELQDKIQKEEHEMKSSILSFIQNLINKKETVELAGRKRKKYEDILVELSSKFYCTECGGKYSSYDSGSVHILTQHKDLCKKPNLNNTKKFQCSACLQNENVTMYDTREEVERHLENNHGIFICNYQGEDFICNQVCGTKYTLVKHWYGVHRSCIFCKENFGNLPIPYTQKTALFNQHLEKCPSHG